MYGTTLCISTSEIDIEPLLVFLRGNERSANHPVLPYRTPQEAVNLAQPEVVGANVRIASEETEIHGGNKPTVVFGIEKCRPQMMKTYSHIRRQALNAAAEALEPTFLNKTPSPLETEAVN